MPERPLRAAEDVVREVSWLLPDAADRLTRRCIAAYLDSVLGDIPEEAVEAWEDAYWHADLSERESLEAFLRSLRTSLEDE